jgi:hypothetical protein
VFLDPALGSFVFQLVLCTIIVGVSYCVLWHYWLGKNWARILVIITSLVALINLVIIQEMNTYEKVVVITEAILAVFLLYWLNTNKVKVFFKEKHLLNQ